MAVYAENRQNVKDKNWLPIANRTLNIYRTENPGT